MPKYNPICKGVEIPSNSILRKGEKLVIPPFSKGDLIK